MTIIPRDIWTPEQALEEFRYACQAWFSCMPPELRQAAVDHAIAVEKTIEFKPRSKPR